MMLESYCKAQLMPKTMCDFSLEIKNVGVRQFTFSVFKYLFISRSTISPLLSY